MYVCGLCGKKLNTVDEYLKHTTKCAEEMRINDEKLKEMSLALDKVKAAKKYYEDQMTEFKMKYPEAYELNFGNLNSKSYPGKDRQVREIGSLGELLRYLYEQD